MESWADLPSGPLLQVAEHHGGDQAFEMRAVCRSWRQALAAHRFPTLRPLGKPAQAQAFPQAAALDYGARGAGQSLTDAELADSTGLLRERLERLTLSGAFQLTAAGLQAAFRAAPALRELVADGSTIQDAAFSGLVQQPEGEAAETSSSSSSSSSAVRPAVVPLGSQRHLGSPLRQLEMLSLRGCLYLRGTLLADLAAACPALSSLDLAACGLALNLHPEIAALLPQLASLRRLVLDGNGLDDEGMRHVAALPSLRELSVRRSTHLTDASLHELARRRGCRWQPRSSTDGASSPSRGGGPGGSGGSGGSRDVGLVSLDISGCSGLTDQCWLALTDMQGLTSLRMEHMNHLLQFPSMPEQLPAALWRLPRLRCLSLAGSCCHPSKLKLLAATCGGSVAHLDISTGGGGSCCKACCCCGGAGGGGGGGSGAAEAQPAGPPYKRLTSLHERDLCEAAQSFRQLSSFRAGGSALPLRVCTAFLEAAPAGRLAELDLSGCSLEADRPHAAAAYSRNSPTHAQLFFSSGARRALNFDELPSVTGNSVSHLAAMHAEAASWQRPATAGRFAAALRRQGASLRSLRLGGAAGLRDRHLGSLGALQALTSLCLAGTGSSAVSGTLLGEVAAGCTALQQLDISGTAAGDECLRAAAAMPALRQLAAGGCTNVGPAGVAALAAGTAARTLRQLDLSQTGADDAAVAALAAACQALRHLHLTGCHQLTPAAVEQLGRLPALNSLLLGRCPRTVTDAGLLALARRLPQLTRLSLAESQGLTAGGLSSALALLPVLADLDLTACSGDLRDDLLVPLLTSKGSTVGGGGSPEPGSSPVTPANIQLPQGSTCPTGSPFRCRTAAAF